MKVLLDTNVISEWVKPQPEPNVVSWLRDLDEDQTFLSVISLGELRAGVEQLEPGRRRARLEAWLDQDLPARFDGRIVSIDQLVAKEWGVLMAGARRAGQSIGVVDALLAATAEVHDFTLATRNVRYFAATSIDIVDPWALPR